MAAAPKRNPAVVAARQQARANARSQGLGAAGVQKAVRQAGRQARYNLPQPPQLAPPPQQDPGHFQYDQTAESQLNQPYQDLAASGATGMLPSVFQRYNQQGQLGDIYGQGAAGNLGLAANSMQGLNQLGGQTMGLGAGTLGQYGQLMAPNLGIQQGLANEIQGIQGGNLDVDPAMVQQFDQQQRLLESQLQRQLGPDWATSSAGIEAMGRFQQGKQTALASANYNRLLGLVGAQQQGLGQIGNTGLAFGGFGQGVQGQQFGQGQQLGNMFGQNAMDLYNQATGMRQNQLAGAGNMLGQLGQIQALYAGIPQTMGQFGQAMSGQAGQAVNAQQPYQTDRFGQFQASQFPTKGQYTGQSLINQGNTLISAASAMGGGGGGGAPQMSDSSMGGGGGGWPMGGY